MGVIDENEETKPVEMIGDIPVRASADEFRPDEMIRCVSCGRSTPPNRLECFYCGAEFDTGGPAAKKIQPSLRPPEEGEPGFSLILMPGAGLADDERLRIVRSITRLADSDLERLFDLNSPVPIARSGSKKAVELAIDRLLDAGLDSRMFEDKQFEPEVMQRRVRGISMQDDGRMAVIMFNNDEVEFLAPEDIVLLVIGRVSEQRIESDERHKGKRVQKVVATTESSDDEVYIDAYVNDVISSFRIQVAGFDFSFLGKDKDLLAATNIKKTITFLRQFAPTAGFDDTYDRIRASLDSVWLPEESDGTRNIKRGAFGSYETKRLLRRSSVRQFTNYSRLQWLAREK